MPNLVTEKQVDYLMSLMGFKPWNNHHTLRDKIKKELDGQMASALINNLKQKQYELVYNQLKYLGCNIDLDTRDYTFQDLH